MGRRFVEFDLPLNTVGHELVAESVRVVRTGVGRPDHTLDPVHSLFLGTLLVPAEDIIHVDVLEPGFVGENPDDTVGFADRIVHPCLCAQTPYGAPNAGYGAPSPYGAPGGYQPNPYAPSGPVLATWGRRALGGLIDFVAPEIVVSMIIGLIFADRTSSVANLLSTVLTLGFWCYNTGYRLATTGYSFGHKIAQVRVVMADSGQTPTVNTAVLRAVCHLLDSWACLIGWLFPLWDAKKQTFADKITKTVSLDERNAGQR